MAFARVMLLAKEEFLSKPGSKKLHKFSDLAWLKRVIRWDVIDPFYACRLFLWVRGESSS